MRNTHTRTWVELHFDRGDLDDAAVELLRRRIPTTYVTRTLAGRQIVIVRQTIQLGHRTFATLRESAFDRNVPLSALIAKWLLQQIRNELKDPYLEPLVS